MNYPFMLTSISAYVPYASICLNHWALFYGWGSLELSVKWLIISFSSSVSKTYNLNDEVQNPNSTNKSVFGEGYHSICFEGSDSYIVAQYLD